MAIKYINEDLVNNKINIVNSNNSELKNMGLLPKFVKVSPAFINLSKEPVYVCSDHFGSNLNNDIKRCLDIMNQDIYKKTSYEEKIFSAIEKEYKKQYKINQKIVNSYDITDLDLSQYINESANIFKSPIYCEKDIKGVYNENAKTIINSLKMSKINIYSFMKELIINSKNLNVTLRNLLKILNRNEFPSNKNEEISQYLLLDLLIQLIGFDKIEIKLNKTITTSKVNIYEEFFNYLLMDYTIVRVPKIVFNKDSNNFKIIQPNKLMQTRKEFEYEEEIKTIKKLVPRNEIHKYFIN